MDVLRLTLRQLQIFVAVAQCGSTRAAAQVVALSQSATSAAVNELERLLSLTLFDRVGKRLQLNDNGRALLPRALAMLDDAAAVVQMAHRAEDQRQTLRVGASTTIGRHVLPGVLAHFLADAPARAPAWHSTVAIGNTAEIAAQVATRALDLGLIEGPCHEPTLQVHPWMDDELVVVGAADTGPTTLDLAQLQAAVWLLREPGSGTREVTDQALLPHLGSYRRSIVLGHSQAIVGSVGVGLGIACLSRAVVADALRAGRLRELRTPLPLLTRRYRWVIHRDKPITPALRRFIAILQAPEQADVDP